MNDHSPEIASAIDELGGVELPDTIELVEVAGRGSCAIVFKALHRGETVALKVYRPAAINTYRDRHGCNIAVYEMSQNRKFRKVQELLPYSAKPIMVLGHDGRQSVCFMQEFIEGQTLIELGRANQGLPPSVLEAGEVIARVAEREGIDGIDLNYRSVLVRQKAGRWLPAIHGFNRPPADAESRGGLLRLFRKTRQPNFEFIREWVKFSEECAA